MNPWEKQGKSQIFRWYSKKMMEVFSVISNLAVTTPIAVEYSGVDFFLEWIFESKQVTKSQGGPKNNLNLKLK